MTRKFSTRWFVIQDRGCSAWICQDPVSWFWTTYTQPTLSWAIKISGSVKHDYIFTCLHLLLTIFVKILVTQAPRTEAVSILGSLLSLPAILAKLPSLQPSEAKINTMTSPYAKVRANHFFTWMDLMRVGTLWIAGSHCRDSFAKLSQRTDGRSEMRGTFEHSDVCLQRIVVQDDASYCTRSDSCTSHGSEGKSNLV